MRLKRHLSIIGHSPDEAELRYGVWNPVSHTLKDDSESGTLLKILMDMRGDLSIQEMLFKRSPIGILPAGLDIGNYGLDSFGILGCGLLAAGYPGEHGNRKNDEHNEKAVDE